MLRRRAHHSSWQTGGTFGVAVVGASFHSLNYYGAVAAE